MAENKTVENKAETVKSEDVKAEPKAPTAEELKAMYDALPDMFKQAIDKVNAEIETHNQKIDEIKAAQATDTVQIKAEIFEQNPRNNKKLATLLTEYQKVAEQLEKIRAAAYDVIDKDGLMPRALTEAEVTKLKAEASESGKSLKDQVTALSQFEEMMPMLKGKILPLVTEIKTQRGTGTKTTGKTGEGPKRLRFKRIEVNGVTSDDKGNTVYGIVDGNEKYTFTLTAQFLNKQHKQINWAGNDLTEAYLKGLDEKNLPEVHEFTMPFTYKAADGNEHTLNYVIKCYR